MKILSKSEMASMAMTAIGITAMNFPMTPETNSIGPKATMVVETEAITEGATSLVPSMAA